MCKLKFILNIEHVYIYTFNNCFFSLQSSEQGKIDYKDLLKFINIKIDPLPPLPPINLKVSS